MLVRKKSEDVIGFSTSNGVRHRFHKHVPSRRHYLSNRISIPRSVSRWILFDTFFPLRHPSSLKKNTLGYGSIIYQIESQNPKGHDQDVFFPVIPPPPLYYFFFSMHFGALKWSGYWCVLAADAGRHWVH